MATVTFTQNVSCSFYTHGRYQQVANITSVTILHAIKAGIHDIVSAQVISVTYMHVCTSYHTGNHVIGVCLISYMILHLKQTCLSSASL